MTGRIEQRRGGRGWLRFNDQPRRFRPRAVLSLCAITFTAGKAVATAHYLRDDATVFDVSFGFGDYVRSLSETRTFEWRLEGMPLRSARMPLMPLIYAGLGKLSPRLVRAVHVKNLVMSGFTASSLGFLLASFSSGSAGEAIWASVCLPVAVSPPVIKHASAADYEEGFLLEILFIWSTAFLLMIRTLAGGREPASRSGAPVLAILCVTAAQMLKSSMMPVFAITDAAALAYALKLRDRRSLCAVALTPLPLLAWGMRNRRVTGRFSLRTSWDGENLFRGWSSEALSLYPDVCLDRMFDLPEAVTADGVRVRISPKASWSDFSSEWEFDRYYRRLSLSWMRSHRADAIRYTWRKARNFFVSVKQSPYTYGGDARENPDRTRLETALTSAWLVAGRFLELAMLGMLYRMWRSGSRQRRGVALGVIAVNGAYALPYLVGFNYERHVTVYLTIVASCVAVMAGELT